MEEKDGRWDTGDDRILNDGVDESSRFENGYKISPFIDILALLDLDVWFHEPHQ
jgi:hypothetical protein